jgi:paraquat-inducible protein A
MTLAQNRLIVLGLVVLSIGLLIPGLFMPVLTIRGVLTREGVTHVAPTLLEKGINDETIGTLKGLINPQVLALLQFTGGDLRKMLIEKLSPQLTAALAKAADDVEVYYQTRSIISAVRNLYDVGSPTPATLILLFSVIVPFTKAALVSAAVFMRDAARRQRVVNFVEAIAKWSMADVFVVAIFIAYLAAQATQTTAGSSAPALVKFDASFGAGFYWFAAYCLFSLASQQYTARVAMRVTDTSPTPSSPQ